VKIHAVTVDAIRHHAAAAYPDECCGALIGIVAQGGAPSVLEALALPNRTLEGPQRFLVRPEDYREAEARARKTGAQLIGFYHSHPDAPPRPSQYDLDHAWPNFSYLIISVAAGQPRGIQSWRLRDDRSAFDEESLEIEALTWATGS
jgi:proteasome lid subunit RPN8/RPN11